jgi:hypothetical protein
MTSKYKYQIKRRDPRALPRRYNARIHDDLGHTCDEECGRCFPFLRAETLLEEATARARKAAASAATASARKHWMKTIPDLTCTLCEATPASTNFKPVLKWIEKQHKGNSIILCPKCAKGTWVMHGPTEWAMGEIGCDQQTTSHENQWIKDGPALMSEKIKEVKKERMALEGETHYTAADEEIIQRAINMHDTTVKVVEILADLSDQYKNDGYADENDGRGNRPLDRSLYRPFRKRKSAAEAKETGAATRDLNLEWKARKETADEKNMTGKEPFGESRNPNKMQK